MPRRAAAPPLVLVSLAACACSRSPAAGTDGTAQPASATADVASAPPAAQAPSAPPASSASAGALASAPAPGAHGAPADSSEETPPPAGSAALDPGRRRAPVVMTVRGASGSAPGPLVVTLDVREPVAAPATLVATYPVAGGASGKKALDVSLANAGTQTHTLALEPGALAPVRVTLDANDPARGTGLHAERTWPEAAAAPPPRPSGPPGGRPPLPGPGR